MIKMGSIFQKIVNKISGNRNNDVGVSKPASFISGSVAPEAPSVFSGFEAQVRAVKEQKGIIAPAPSFATPNTTSVTESERPRVKDEVLQKEKDDKRFSDIHNSLHAGFQFSAQTFGASGARMSLSDLPTVDPSQSISNIGSSDSSLTGGLLSSAFAAQSAPVVNEPEKVEPEPEKPLTAEDLNIKKSAGSLFTEPVITQQPVYEPAISNPSLNNQVSYLGGRTEEQLPVPEPVMEEPAMEEPETVTDVNDNGKPNCYYTMVTVKAIYPEKGSRKIVRDCDNESVWTDEQSDRDWPMPLVCPVCNKPVIRSCIEV